jgi:sRNA-binding protein
VRGTAHQVIERYEQMANDARLAGDPVAAENCLQHVEHYVRRLETAKRAEDARREEQAQRMRERQAKLAETLPENNESRGGAIAIEPKAEGREDDRIQIQKRSSQQDARAQRLLEAGEAFGKAL